MSDSMRPHRRQPTRLPHLWDSPGKNTGVCCHFLLQCMKVESESEVAQSCPTLSDPMDCSPPGSSARGIFQARVLEWHAIAFAEVQRRVERGITISPVRHSYHSCVPARTILCTFRHTVHPLRKAGWSSNFPGVGWGWGGGRHVSPTERSADSPSSSPTPTPVRCTCLPQMKIIVSDKTVLFVGECRSCEQSRAKERALDQRMKGHLSRFSR